MNEIPPDRSRRSEAACHRLGIPVLLLGLMFAVAPVPHSSAARAAVTSVDVQVAGRILGFLSPPDTGNIKVGIVYDPSNPASTADEQALTAILGSGLQVAGANLVPVAVPIASLTGTQVGMYILTSNVGAKAALLGAATAAQKTLCITTDLSATQAGYCAVAVQSMPSVQITVNNAVAAASGLNFAAPFLLMINKI